MMERISFSWVSRSLLFINIIVLFSYFSWWFWLGHVKSVWLYSFLFLGEIYHVFMALTFWFTVRGNTNPFPNQDRTLTPSVDAYITVAGEPIEVVEPTLRAVMSMNYPNFQVYILNDGFVAKKAHWKEMEELGERLGISVITRKIGGGAKAGNINNALRLTHGEYIAIFDADMVPRTDFLSRTIPYFVDERMGFVQTPQFYENALENEVTGSSWEQQQLFFGPIMEGKNASNAAFICGTNVVIRRQTLEGVGGMREDNIAEDFLTSLNIHQQGWRSYYLNEVLVKGLAPQDLLSYFKQQLRWARGSLEVLFGDNPLLKKGLTWKQRLEYLSSGLYYLNGLIVVLDISIPLFSLFTGIEPVSSATTSFAVLFLPFIFLTFLTLYLVSGKNLSFRALAFSQSSWTIHLLALHSLMFRKNMKFSVTPKKAQQGNYLYLAFPHIVYILVTIAASIVGFSREGFTPSIATNISWALFNSIMFLPFIIAALPKQTLREKFFLQTKYRFIEANDRV